MLPWEQECTWREVFNYFSDTAPGPGGRGKTKKNLFREEKHFSGILFWWYFAYQRKLCRCLCAPQRKGGGGGCLKVHKHDFFNTFFAETETIWSQGLVTRDFENRIRFGRDIRLSNISAHAPHAMKSVPRMLSMRRNSFGVCSATDKIRSAHAEHILNDNS